MRRFLFQDRRHIYNVDGFLRDLDELRRNMRSTGRTWYFRGDSYTDPLCPSIGRELRFAGRSLVASEGLEKRLLDRFKRFAWGHLNRVQSDWEAMFLARHYDLPAQILDWSGNPLVALYFACAPMRENAQRGAVWGLLRITDETEDLKILESEDPFALPPADVRAVKLVYPVYNSGRIAAQKGIFTWHSHPREPLDGYAGQEFEDDRLDVAHLVRWSVNPRAVQSTRTRIVEALERLGVNQRSIFPDLGGLAKGLWHTAVLWQDNR
jgi:hypothetical protein